MQNKLIKKLDIDDLDIISIGGKYHNNKDLMKFPKIDDPSLVNEKWINNKDKDLSKITSLLDTIQEKDYLIHVPYESFDYFIALLQEASISPLVSEIKTSIYRAAKDSKVVQALINASRNGKKVSAMVELLARFDESSNISISQTLKEAGVNIITGQEGFKIHGK